jgi:hypothetical protein
MRLWVEPSALDEIAALPGHMRQLIGREVLDLADGQDIHLHISPGDLLRNCSGDLGGRTSQRGIGNKDSLHTRLSSVLSERVRSRL